MPSYRYQQKFVAVGNMRRDTEAEFPIFDLSVVPVYFSPRSASRPAAGHPCGHHFNQSRQNKTRYFCELKTVESIAPAQRVRHSGAWRAFQSVSHRLGHTPAQRVLPRKRLLEPPTVYRHRSYRLWFRFSNRRGEIQYVPVTTYPDDRAVVTFNHRHALQGRRRYRRNDRLLWHDVTV
jgi:hypothetical protein